MTEALTCPAHSFRSSVPTVHRTSTRPARLATEMLRRRHMLLSHVEDITASFTPRRRWPRHPFPAGARSCV